MDFYTNVILDRGKIYARGIKNGIPHREVFKYSPYLFAASPNKKTKYKTIDDKPVERIDFDSVWDAREYVKLYGDVEGFNIYGLTDYKYLYIYDYFPGVVKYNPEQIRVANIDIENKMTVRMPINRAIVETPNEITAISLRMNGKVHAFGVKDFNNLDENVTYYHCKDEIDLLHKFIAVWKMLDPDVVTGWNIEFYDIPYLINRIIKILGESVAMQLSPWGKLNQYSVEVKGKDCPSFEIAGITTLDYMQIYKKFILSPRDSYKLDAIAEHDLGINKIDYSEYDDLDDLYENDHQKYIEYNIWDTYLVEKLEEEHRLIELVYAIAYEAKVNYADTLGSVKVWDVLIHNYLMDQGIVVPPEKRSFKSSFAGGHVEVPKLGMHEWVVSFDLNSLYPHLIMHYNISPEMFRGRLSSFPSIDDILAGKFEIPDDEFSYAANGCYYAREEMGFLGKLMEHFYKGRSEHKRQMINFMKELEKTSPDDLIKRRELAGEISRLYNLQHAFKILLNSAYGVLGNQYFRWFEINNAEAITLSGQLSIRWVSQELNKYMNKICKTKDVDYLIYCDTDSAYFKFDTLVKNMAPKNATKLQITRALDKFCEAKIQPEIERIYTELSKMMNSYSQSMYMKRENIADRGVWLAKKRYMLNVYNSEGVEYKEPEIKMTGIQAVQSSTPMIVRDEIKSNIKTVMEGTEDEIQEAVLAFKEAFKTHSYSDIASPRGISDYDKWDCKEGFISKTPIHVKGAILYNRLIKEKGLDKYEAIGSGDKIKYSYLKQPNPFFSNVISCPDELPPEFGMEEYIDYDTQFEKSFIRPLDAILKVIGWEYEKKATLDSFFG